MPVLYCVTLCAACFLHPLQKVFFDFGTCSIAKRSSPRSVSARDLRESPKARDASTASRAETPSTPTRRRGKRREVISFARSFTYVHHFSHTGAPQRGVSRLNRPRSRPRPRPRPRPRGRKTTDRPTTLGGVRIRARGRPSRQRWTREAGRRSEAREAVNEKFLSSRRPRTLARRDQSAGTPGGETAAWRSTTNSAGRRARASTDVIYAASRDIRRRFA